MIDISVTPDNAVMVAVSTPNCPYEKTKEYLEELAFLIDTAGGVAVKSFIQRLQFKDPHTFVGSGKLEEIKEYIEAEEIQFVVFDDELTPTQMRNIEKELDRKVMDRTGLILNIFAQRARTAHSKTQVELAQYQYLYPRLTRMWTHLDRQRGGGGMTMRGPGETQIETDRRIVLDKISYLKEKLKDIDKQKIVQRKSRESLIRVALVGYTNVGKSTIMNLLAKSEVFAENKLFATLDTTVRKVVIENLPFLLTDTVGFIRKLPHGLVESFKSTLDEVRESDVLIHVVDISHPGFEEQIEVVKQTLQEIDSSDKPTIMVFNKIDAYTYIKKDEDDLTPVLRENWSLEDLKASWMGNTDTPSFFISAKEKENIDELKNAMYESIKHMHAIRYPFNNFLY
ncbi:MAG: GTPase HflX [Bacteroidales bacterium]|jgi:GTP-binding protein HflX